MSKSYTVIDNETGEIIKTIKTDTLEDRQRKKYFAERKHQGECFHITQEELCGNFVFFMYANMDYLCEIMSDNDLVKFMYLGTFVEPDGALGFTKKELRDILNCSYAAFNKFYGTMIGNQLLKEKDGQLYINLGYFWRGKLKHKPRGKFTRLYIKTTRFLYETTDFRQHSKLAIVYKLLPFVGGQYNLICRNPDEKDKKLVKRMPLRDVLKYLGYHPKNITRFRKDFFNIWCMGEKMFICVQDDPDYLNSYILINPMVFYRGYETKELLKMKGLFKI